MRLQLRRLPFIPLNPEIFRAYDIRGVYPDSLTTDVAFMVGQAFATVVAEESKRPQPVIVTVRDGRASSPPLSETVIDGMMSAGAEVIELGVGPSPLCYFGMHYLEADACIMVTGSHNPPTHNGFKMLLKE